MSPACNDAPRSRKCMRTPGAAHQRLLLLRVNLSDEHVFR
mgnify:CR=1 FL=1